VARRLGLGQYEANFRDNKIDADLLPRLTDVGLKDIGVSALGDRLRLLDAIAELAAPSPSIERHPPPSSVVRPKTPEVSAERRPITVMFCDLVGSTALASGLDAEDWRSQAQRKLGSPRIFCLCGPACGPGSARMGGILALCCPDRNLSTWPSTGLARRGKWQATSDECRAALGWSHGRPPDSERVHRVHAGREGKHSFAIAIRIAEPSLQ
jgi:hypothetical protein